MALTPQQRAGMQGVYNAILGGLKVRYGASLVGLSAIRFIVGSGDDITSLYVHITIEATDADGEKVQRRKEIELW